VHSLLREARCYAQIFEPGSLSDDTAFRPVRALERLPIVIDSQLPTRNRDLESPREHSEGLAGARSLRLLGLLGLRALLELRNLVRIASWVLPPHPTTNNRTTIECLVVITPHLSTRPHSFSIAALNSRASLPCTSVSALSPPRARTVRERPHRPQSSAISTWKLMKTLFSAPPEANLRVTCHVDFRALLFRL